MIKKFITMLMIISVLSLQCCCAHAYDAKQEEKPFNKEAFMDFAENSIVLELSLEDCVELALENNLKIQIKRKDPVIAKNAIKKAKGAFEPAIAGYYNYAETELPSQTPRLTGNIQDMSRRKDYNICFEGKTILNTQYEIGWDNYTESSNSALQRFFPDYGSSLNSTIVQPVLKDFFGLGQDQADLIIAKNNKDISDYSFLNEAIDVVTDVKNTYYDYQSGLDQYEIGKAALKRSQNLMNIIKARYDKGMTSSAELLETEAGIAKREEALLTFERALKKAEDNLKLVTNLVDKPAFWNADIRIQDKPEFNVEEVGLAEGIRDAFANRPDYKAAATDLKNKDIDIKTAQNSLLPAVDIVATYAASGLGDKYSSALDQAGDGINSSWSAGVKVRVPFGFEKEISDYEISKLEKEKAVIAFSLLEQQIILQVRDAVRDVDIAYRNVKASKKTLEAEEKTYEANKQRFSQGMVSTHDILQYQENLDTASLNYLKGLIYYNKALNHLDRITGTTLSQNDIVVEG
jgi:outer membrane protein TolC